MTATIAAQAEVHVLYGSETGNAEFLCDDLVEALGTHGITADSGPLDDIDPARLATLGTALIIVSTTGEGDMPYGAETFWERIDTADAPSCSALRYAVLALGDSTYTYFCEAGTLIDTRLAELGATRIAERVNCDAAYDKRAEEWITERVAQLGALAADVVTLPSVDEPSDDGWDAHDWGLDVLGDDTTPTATMFGGSVTQFEAAASVPARSAWTREHPFAAEVTARVHMGGPDGEVVHVELDLGDSGIVVQPGDSLGVVAVNDPYAVDRFIEATGLGPKQQVGDRMLQDLARDEWELRFPSMPLLETTAARAPKSSLGVIMASGDRIARDAWVEANAIADVLALLPHPFTPDELAQLMRPVRARAYSVASSTLTHPGSAHLIAALERVPATQVAPSMMTGVASGYLTRRTTPGDRIRIFPMPNRSFRLPEDPAAPVIMVGTGVGVAPFRAFLQERSHEPEAGPAWLFFGSRHEKNGYYYRDEWEQFGRTGVLDRLDTAFSRDQPEKIYVEQRMRAHAAELTQWLQDGAYWYVCGDARHMAPDVEETLRRILIGELGETAGSALFTRLHEEKRYRCDVY